MAARPLCRLVRAAGLRKIPDPDGALNNREQSGHVACVRRPAPEVVRHRLVLTPDAHQKTMSPSL